MKYYLTPMALWAIMFNCMPEEYAGQIPFLMLICALGFGASHSEKSMWAGLQCFYASGLVFWITEFGMQMGEVAISCWTLLATISGWIQYLDSKSREQKLAAGIEQK